MRWLAAVLLLVSSVAQAVTAEAYIVTDMDGTTLIEKNADEVRSIASITKLFVAEKALGLDPAELITVLPADIKAGRMRSTPLRAGQQYTRKQLIELALVSSDNVAASALGRTLPDLATKSAELVEATGLNPANQSTARRLAQAARELYATEVGRVSTEAKTEVGSRSSTNPLLDRQGWTFYLSKTGFINASGGCLVVVFDLNGRLVTAVILGARNTKERWSDLIELRRQLGDTSFYVPIKVTKVRKKRR